jgi:hypothetical protein
MYVALARIAPPVPSPLAEAAAAPLGFRGACVLPWPRWPPARCKFDQAAVAAVL